MRVFFIVEREVAVGDRSGKLPGRSKIPGPFRVLREAKQRGLHRVGERLEEARIVSLAGSPMCLEGW